MLLSEDSWVGSGQGWVSEGGAPRKKFSDSTQKRFIFRAFQALFCKIRGNLNLNGGAAG